MEEKVITFYSTNYALRAERVLREANISAITIPTPRYLSATCGIALKYKKELEEKILKTLKEKGIEFEGTFELKPKEA